MRVELDRATDEWYESEESTRVAMIEELQRIRRRTRVRPLPVLALAALITGFLVYKIVTRKTPVEAEVVLALTEGTLSAKHNGLHVDALRDYVTTVLLPNAKLAKLIEQHKLARIRPGFGIDTAVSELRENFDIQIWKNSFMYYDEDAENAEHSARIGVTYHDFDPDRAFELARDLAQVIIDTGFELRQKDARILSDKIDALRKSLEDQVAGLAATRAKKLLALSNAKRDHKDSLAQALALELVDIDHHQRSAEGELSRIATSQDTRFDEIAAAGLDMSLEIVEERPPERAESHAFVIVMIVVVIAIGALFGSALLVGAFDSRIHDTDDVQRLGLPILGHVPGFPGDGMGSLRDRGASRARVPSFLRWRSHR